MHKVEIGDGVYPLEPTLKALIPLSDKYDGLIGAISRLRMMDVGATVVMLELLLAGSGHTVKLADIHEAVEKAGMTEYVTLLMEVLHEAMSARPEEDAEVAAEDAADKSG